MSIADEPKQRTARTIDWRSWLALSWVVWFGLLYGKMVIEQRGDRIRGLLFSSAKSK